MTSIKMCANNTLIMAGVLRGGKYSSTDSRLQNRRKSEYRIHRNTQDKSVRSVHKALTKHTAADTFAAAC